MFLCRTYGITGDIFDCHKSGLGTFLIATNQVWGHFWLPQIRFGDIFDCHKSGLGTFFVFLQLWKSPPRASQSLRKMMLAQPERSPVGQTSTRNTKVVPVFVCCVFQGEEVLCRLTVWLQHEHRLRPRSQPVHSRAHKHHLGPQERCILESFRN